MGLSDEDLLYEIESLGDGLHDRDDVLLEVVRSDRHFFIRQEAAKKIRDPELLKTHAEDRHIGQILVRVMTRAADVDYLERLVGETRYLEVRKAAESQLRVIADRIRSGRPR
ncbi:MAG TPA: hypothetical protein VN461_12220 [Vicinamibacteria bacterium]|nr:hypothetical protein [Vicinamibacteria bacterium]